MPPDSGPTKARILEAAFREFAAHGLAGARVDRIAASARANKRAIYAYFGNKEALFEIVLLDKLAMSTANVPATWRDLPAYAGDLFDYLADDPDRVRLNAWRQLERPETTEAEAEFFHDALVSMRASMSAHETMDVAELFALIYSVHHAWLMAPRALWATDPSAIDDTVRRRAAAVEAVRRLVTPRHLPETG